MELESSSVLVVLVRNLLLELVGKEDRRLDLTFATTCRAGLFHMHLHGRANALARDLHQTELTERKHIVFRAIALHEFAYVVIQLVLMLFGIHIDEIYDDDTAYIAQTELVNQLIRGQHIKLERILLLVLEDLLTA